MAESSTTSETPPPRPSIERFMRSCAALATRRALDAARRLNRAESAAASPDLCQTFDKGRAGSGERVPRGPPVRKWRGRTGDISGKSRRKYGCKDGGVQAAEVGRALGSTCPHHRAAALARQRQEIQKIAAQLPATGLDGLRRWPPEVLPCKRSILAADSSRARGPKRRVERSPIGGHRG